MTAETKPLIAEIKEGLRAAKKLNIDYIYLSAQDAQKMVSLLEDVREAHHPFMGEGRGTHLWKCGNCEKEILDPFGSQYCRKCGARIKWG